MVKLLVASADTTLTDFYTAYIAKAQITGAMTTTQKDTLTFLQEEGAPSVLLLDMPLPDEAGGSIVRFMRANAAYEHARIVMLLEEGISILARPRLGIEHIFYKPIALTELGQYLTNLLATTEM